MLIRLSSLTFLIFSACSFSKYTQKEANIKFDETSVLEDLTSATMENGEKFNLENFPPKANTSPSIITFIEYCYSADVNYLKNYNLYLYFYNPGNCKIDYDSSSNMIQLSTGNENDYNKYSLVFLDSSDDNLFLKYRVNLKNDEKEKIYNSLNCDKRIYSISSFEFSINNKINDFTSGGTYIYSGYSAGYDGNDESTLSYTKEELETISVEPEQTCYRLDSSPLGTNYQSQLNSVYFSIPNVLLEKYGNLQKIKAQWYEYRSSPIVVVEDETFYNNFNAIKGIKVYDPIQNPKGVELEKTSISELFPESQCCFTDRGDNFSYLDNCEYIFNFPEYNGTPYVSYYYYNIPEISWVFRTHTLSYSDYTINTNELLNYANDFNFYNFGKVENNYSKDLFLGEIEEGRKEGLNIKEFDANDEMNLLDYSTNNNGWDKFLDYFGNWWNIPGSEQIENINPIYKVNYDDFTDDNASDNLLVDKNDLYNLKTYMQLNNSDNKSTFLFRFATTQYYSKAVHFGSGLMTTRNGYVAEETVFLNFDILQFTFNKDGESIVIPVVMDPIDIFSEITPPIEENTQNYLSLLISSIITLGLIVLTVWLIYKLILIFK